MINKILVIDDDEAIRKSFSLTLMDNGFEVDLAESGTKGINMIASNNYILILLDLKMPGLDGTETLREIRKINSKIPVFIVTAFHDEFLIKLKKLDHDNIKYELFKKTIGSKRLLSLVKSVLDGPQVI